MRAVFAGLVTRRWLVLVLALAVTAGGWYNLQRLAIDAVPDISPKQVMILTQAAGLGPLEVERLVTTPLEMQMAGLPLLKDIRSSSLFGLSAVYVTFDDSADVQTARALVFERLQQASAMMPPGVGTPVEGPFATGLGEILEFELRGPGYTPMQLYQMLQWRIVPQLRLVPGIVDVNIYGGELETYEVQVSPGRLRARGITLPQLFAAIQANNTTRGGAYINHGDEQEIVRGMALVHNRADIAGIVLTASGSIPVTIGDVATVRLAPKVRMGAVTHDGAGETIVGVADMQYGLNASEVLPALKSRIAAVQKSLPPGMDIHIFYDRSDLIQRAIQTVAHNLVEGALLVVAILLLMLGNLRAGLIVATVIPLSMMMAFVGMRVLGISGNLMSLGAIDFGLVVDGAVVLVENVLRHQESAHAPRDRGRLIADAATEVARPVLFSVLIITLVYLPVLSLRDIEGKTFRPMALTVILALASALVVTMLVVPALVGAFLSPRAAEKETRLVRWSRGAYSPILSRAMAHPVITVGLAAVLFTISMAFALGLGGEFVPQLSEGAIVVTSNKLPSINLAASLRMVTAIEKVLRSFPDVQAVVSQTGSAAVPTDPMMVASTDTYVILKPPRQWTTAPTQQGIRAAMAARVKAAIPGAEFEFSQPIQMRMDDLLQGVRSDIGLTIYGQDLTTLRKLADQAVAIVKRVRGAGDVRAEQQAGLPALTIDIDRSRLARYGISAADALATVEAVGGHEAGIVYGADGSEAPIMVRLAPAARADLADIGSLPIGLAGGHAIPLSAVADIGVANGPADIEHDRLQRRIDIDINVDGRDLEGFVQDAQAAVTRELRLPPEYSLGWNGTFQNLRDTNAILAKIVPAVLAVVFLLLYLNFGNLRLAALIFLNVPMAATGGVFALVLRGMPFSVTAAIGFISTFGIAILDGVVLASYIEQERARGRLAREAAYDAAEKRLRPVLTTALVASVGFVPMALSTSAGAEVQRPLATVVIGGLISATLLTLLVLPSLYPLVMEPKVVAWRRREAAAE
jgi:cobalt-zinc-cadmium resistance protein CzcA